MPSFLYVARDAGTGREIRSNIDASSEQAAIASLLGRNLLVMNIQEHMALGLLKRNIGLMLLNGLVNKIRI